MVGGMLMKRSSTLALDCERLEAMPALYASRAGLVVALVEIGGLGCAGDDAQRDRRAEYLDVVVVDLVLEAGGSGLIETVELVEIDGVAIRHEQPMEGDGEALLAEAGDLLHIAQDERAFRDQADAGGPGCRWDWSP